MTVEITTAEGKTVRTTHPLEVKDGTARFVWPRSQVPAGAKNVALKPDFAMAKTGEDGYWVFPNNTLGRFTQTEGRVREGWHVSMPMYGMKTPRGTFCAIATGMPYSLSLVAEAKKKFPQLRGEVVGIVNDFFGHTIDVAGLLTAQDIIRHLRGRELGERIYIPKTMLRHGEGVFLDDLTPEDVSRELGVPVIPLEVDGAELLAAMRFEEL